LSVEGAIESTGIPEQYGVASGLVSWVSQKKLSTRFEEKPDWFKWTETEIKDEDMHHEK
jgi:hypothetical protein